MDFLSRHRKSQECMILNEDVAISNIIPFKTFPKMLKLHFSAAKNIFVGNVAISKSPLVNATWQCLLKGGQQHLFSSNRRTHLTRARLQTIL